MAITLAQATLSDAARLYEMQLAAFKPLLDKYQDFDTNPAAEKLERTVARLGESDSHYYFIRLGGADIGAIRVKDFGELCVLNRIFILPEHQGMGYAQEAISLAEDLHCGAKSWVLDTIKQEARLCHLYEKMGYSLTGEEKRVNDRMTLVTYRK
jgi:RimJ/RimL family protein N-acetyltransferase